MYVLMHNNVDNYPSVFYDWESKPTKEQLVKTLEEFHGDEATSIADELLRHGEYDVRDSSCTTYELQKR
jgi:hypothetical protein